MKFGKVLLQSMHMSSAAWEPFWFDYKLLKKIIKDCAQIQKEEQIDGDKIVKKKIKPSAREDNDSIRRSADEMKFFRTLRQEIKKIAEFFVKEQTRYTSLVAQVETQFQELKSSPSETTKTALMQSCVTMYKELLLLENFAVMNFCGVSKILKKHDKWTGYATRHKFMHTILMKQPFSTYCPLLQMINRLEQIFMESTGCSIDQHDRRPSRTPFEQVLAESESSTSRHDGKHDEKSEQYDDGVSEAVMKEPDGAEDGEADTSNVTLGRVQSLRDDAKELEKIERLSNETNEDDGQADDKMPPGALDEESEGEETKSEEADSHRSEAEAMLSLATAATDASAKDASSPSSDSIHLPRLNKRKACSPVMEDSGKRKMSFATILN